MKRNSAPASLTCRGLPASRSPELPAAGPSVARPPHFVVSVTMDVEPLYCAEQIRVPDELPDILKQWTKDVIRSQPSNIYEFSAR